jgi:hypothetical protein
MGEARMHDEHIGDYNAQDYMIALLTAITLAGVAAATIFGLFYGAFFALDYFGVELPRSGLIYTAITVAYNALPVLVGLFTLWRSYVKVLDMP